MLLLEEVLVHHSISFTTFFQVREEEIIIEIWRSIHFSDVKLVTMRLLFVQQFSLISIPRHPLFLVEILRGFVPYFDDTQIKHIKSLLIC